jgi:vacuolar protein sorting-associated protein 52
MWLDRLSGISTPAPRPNTSSTPQSRSYSPAPRRSSRLLPQTGPQRPSFSPRSSSLSAVSNDSTASLLGNTRKPTDASSSNLKSTTLTYSDPIQVLDRLLDIDLESSLGANKDERWDRDELLGDVDFVGLTLHEFVQGDQANDSQVGGPPTTAKCSYYTIDNVDLHAHQVYTDEIDKARFEDLHQSIRACNDILNSVELNLASFQNDLGDVSAEIETLRARSTTLSSRLENRKVVEHGLTPVVEELTVSQTIVKSISEGEIDEAWIIALNAVGKWSKALNAKAIETHNIKSVADLKPLRDQLVNIVSKSN